MAPELVHVQLLGSFSISVGAKTAGLWPRGQRQAAPGALVLEPKSPYFKRGCLRYPFRLDIELKLGPGRVLTCWRLGNQPHSFQKRGGRPPLGQDSEIAD